MDRAFRLRDSPKWRPRWPVQGEAEKWGRHKRAEGSLKANSCTRGARKRSALTATRASAETDKERTQYVAGDGPIENDRPGCDQELSIAQKRPHQSAARDALGAGRNVVGIRSRVFPGNMKGSFQAARSIG